MGIIFGRQVPEIAMCCYPVRSVSEDERYIFLPDKREEMVGLLAFSLVQFFLNKKKPIFSLVQDWALRKPELRHTIL